MKKFFIPMAALGMLIPAAHAQPAPQTYLDSNLRSSINAFLDNDIVFKALEFQNERHADLDQQGVVAMDNMWRNQREKEDRPFIAAVLSNPLSTYLTRVQAHSNGVFTEIFIMDDKGLNVGQSSISSDYWQGDEAKWQRTYQGNVGAVFIDEPEFNSATEQWRVQYNVAIPNEDGSENIGAATVEVNLSELARRANQ